MEKLDELLEKYFRAETTIIEENILKNYFLSDNVTPELEIYRPLFIVFDEERQEIIEPELKIIAPEKRIRFRLWIKTISYSGIAAAILLTLWFQRPSSSENYAIVSGNRIEDSEFAIKYAETKLNRASDILKSGMKPMQSIDKVRESLKPMGKVTETNDKITEIKNKINFK